ncbi:MAG: hypothetical protein AAGH89_05325 [Verrucomicrobiota bacterium]
MRRYFLISAIIGAIAVFVTILAYEFGLLTAAANKLATFYANAGLISHGEQPARGLHYVTFIVLAFAVSWAVIDIPKVANKVVVVLGSMMLVLAASAVAVTLGLFFEPFSSLTAIFVVSALGIVYSMTEHGGRKHLLHTVLGGRVSEESFGGLMNGERPDFLDGQNREVSMLTVRVFNHGEIRAVVDPRDLIEMTNLFLKNSGEFLTSKGGYLDESSPDCVRVYFGILDRQPDHPFRACQAALELRLRLANLNLELEKRYFQRLHYGIAISSEPMTLGIYESENDVRLSAVGEVIEFVRKLSAANSQYGSEILISSRTYTIIQDAFAVRPMEMIFDASADLMSEVYELVDLKENMSEEEEAARQAFWQGLIYYREGRGEEALKVFSELRAKYPNDRPLHYFIDRAQTNMVEVAEKSPTDPDAHLMHGHARVLHSL